MYWPWNPNFAACAPRDTNMVSPIWKLFRRSLRGRRKSPATSVARPVIVKYPNFSPGSHDIDGAMSTVRTLSASDTERLMPPLIVLSSADENRCWCSTVTYWLRECSFVNVIGGLFGGCRSTLPFSTVYLAKRLSPLANR